MGINREQVFQVADKLANLNQPTTLAAVRRNVGGGSYTTISEFMAEWRAHKMASAQPIRESAPQSVTERLQTLGNDIWATAMELANARLMAEREALEGHRQELEQRQTEMAEMADQMAEEIDGLKNRLADAEKHAGTLSAQIQQLQEQNSHWQGEAEKAQVIAGEMHNRLDDLHRLHKAAEQKLAEDTARLKAECDQFRRENTIAREEGAHVRGQLGAQETRANKLENELQQSQSQASLAREAAAALRVQLEATEVQLRQLRDHTHSQIEEARQQAREAQNKVSQLQELTAEKGQLKDAELSQAREAAAALRGQVQTLESQNQALLEKIGPDYPAP